MTDDQAQTDRVLATIAPSAPRRAVGIAVLAALGGLLLYLGMANPPALRLRLLKVGPLSASEAGQLGLRLREIPGVAEAVVIAEEGMAYLKVDARVLDQAALDEFSAARA